MNTAEQEVVHLTAETALIALKHDKICKFFNPWPIIDLTRTGKMNKLDLRFHTCGPILNLVSVEKHKRPCILPEETMRIKIYVLTALILSTATSSLMAADAAPELMNFQALLTDSLDNPLEGDYAIDFAIYGSPDGPDILWQESHGTITLVKGQLAVILGQGDPSVPIDASVFSTSETWISVKVDGEELLPRTRLVTSPYSQRVSTVDKADGGQITGSISITPAAAKDGTEYETSLIVTGNDADSVIISPADDIGIRVTADNGEPAVEMNAGNASGEIRVTSSDAAKGPNSVVRQLIMDPSQEVVFSAIDQNGDSSVMITAGDAGGAIRVTSSDAAKAGKNAAQVTGSKISIDPSQSSFFNYTEGDGDTVLMMALGDLGGEIRVTSSDAAKMFNTGAVIINSDGIFLFGESESDTTLQLRADGGDIVAEGQIATGEESENIGDWATVFGYNNQATGDTSVISGGSNSVADSALTSIGGGASHHASAVGATIGGGLANTATGFASTVGGGENNVASGVHSTVPGGFGNTASELLTFAAGSWSQAIHEGAVVITANADLESDPDGDETTVSGGEEQMVLRADGGLYVMNEPGQAPYDESKLINTSTGAYLSAGGVWTNASDERLKENFSDVDPEAVLKLISQLKISKWNYRSEDPNVNHIGPTAQDFYRLFGLGNDDKTISTIDPAGIALAAIQALDRKTKELETETSRLEELESEIDELRTANDELRELVRQLADDTRNR
jgi:hypothetical protein